MLWLDKSAHMCNHWHMGKTARNEAWMRAEQQRRRSNVAVPFRNRKKYRRKVKHKDRAND